MLWAGAVPAVRAYRAAEACRAEGAAGPAREWGARVLFRAPYRGRGSLQGPSFFRDRNRVLLTYTLVF